MHSRENLEGNFVFDTHIAVENQYFEDEHTAYLLDNLNDKNFIFPLGKNLGYHKLAAE